uniref:transaldolase family protein n=1 Tax=Vaginimicrobium propionicum TaxID=1871034 RepID=UPI0009706E5C|nr:transaldolase family protein [Vaginimicrobium propionicum]
MSDKVPVELYLDTADRADAEPWLATGLFRGLTTNPKLLDQAGLGVNDISTVYEWAGSSTRTVFFQVWGRSLKEMTEAAYHLLEMAPRAGIKIPCTQDGIKLTKRLSGEGVTTLLTAVYASKQMFAASVAGASYVAPYFNRAFLAGRPVLDELSKMVTICPQDGSGPLILAASIKSANHMVEMALSGVRCFTISTQVAADIIQDELSVRDTLDFENHMAKVLSR